MIYRILADAVLILHLCFIVFALLGALLILWRTWLIVLHLPAAVWASLIELNRWPCPLTPLENWLRSAAGAQGYSGGFVEHYIIPALYPAGLTPVMQLALGLVATTINLLLYSFVGYRLFKGRHRE